MKKILVLLTILALVFTLCACSSSDTSEAAQETTNVEMPAEGEMTPQEGMMPAEGEMMPQEGMMPEGDRGEMQGDMDMSGDREMPQDGMMQGEMGMQGMPEMGAEAMPMIGEADIVGTVTEVNDDVILIAPIDAEEENIEITIPADITLELGEYANIEVDMVLAITLDDDGAVSTVMVVPTMGDQQMMQGGQQMQGGQMQGQQMQGGQQ